MAGYVLGKIVPDIFVADSEGQLKLLSAQVGKRGLLIFVLRGTWCPTCVAQIQTVRRHYQKYASEGVETVFISPEAEENVWAYRISQPTPLPFGLYADPNHQTAQLFIQDEAVGTLPAAYLLDGERRVVWRYLGTRADDRPSHQQILDAVTQFLPSIAVTG